MSKQFALKNRFPKPQTRISDPRDVIDEFPDDEDEQMFGEMGFRSNKSRFAIIGHSMQKGKSVHYNTQGQSAMTSGQNVQVLTPQKQQPVTSGQPHQTASFLTASISTVKQWSRYRDEIPMLIEVFGILESLKVMDPQKSYAKQFELQDQGGGSLLCTFYETDRPLLKVDIGQILRCVGIVQRDGTLLCVSVRSATKQEYQLRNKLMAVSAKAMYNRMAKLNEM